MSGHKPGPRPEPLPDEGRGEDPASEIFGELKDLKAIWQGKRDPSRPPGPSPDGAAQVAGGPDPAPPQATGMPASPAPVDDSDLAEQDDGLPVLQEEPSVDSHAIPPPPLRETLTFEPNVQADWNTFYDLHRDLFRVKPNFQQIANEMMWFGLQVALRSKALYRIAQAMRQEPAASAPLRQAAVRRYLHRYYARLVQRLIDRGR